MTQGGAKYGFMRVRGGNGVKICVHKHTTSRGSGGMPPPENICILDSLRLLLMHSQVPENDQKLKLLLFLMHSPVPIGKCTVCNNNQSIDYADQWC